MMGVPVGLLAALGCGGAGVTEVTEITEITGVTGETGETQNFAAIVDCDDNRKEAGLL